MSEKFVMTAEPSNEEPDGDLAKKAFAAMGLGADELYFEFKPASEMPLDQIATRWDALLGELGIYEDISDIDMSHEDLAGYYNHILNEMTEEELVPKLAGFLEQIEKIDGQYSQVEFVRGTPELNLALQRMRTLLSGATPVGGLPK